MHYEFEVESAPGISFPWLTIPIFAGASPTAPEWQGATIQRITVDGVEYDPALAFRRRSRTQFTGNPRFEGVILEESAVRVPVSLEPNRRRCTFVLEFSLHGALASLFDEDSYFVDIVHITDEIDVQISGVDDLQIFCSSNADYRVQASQFSGELLDAADSQNQSSTCQMRNGVRWRSTNTKIGYRYEIAISAQRLTMDTSSAPR